MSSKSIFDESNEYTNEYVYFFFNKLVLAFVFYLIGEVRIGNVKITPCGTEEQRYLFDFALIYLICVFFFIKKTNPFT